MYLFGIFFGNRLQYVGCEGVFIFHPLGMIISYFNLIRKIMPVGLCANFLIGFVDFGFMLLVTDTVGGKLC